MANSKKMIAATLETRDSSCAEQMSSGKVSLYYWVGLGLYAEIGITNL